MADQPDTNQLRTLLKSYIANRQTVDYRTVANLLGFRPPNTIGQTTALLEACQEDDALLGKPQIACVVIQKTGQPYPRPGFYQKLTELNIYQGPEKGAQALMWHQNELEKVFIFYSK